MELNASDERGIQVVRDKIKKYSQKLVTKIDKNCPPFQIVILDEADSMTIDAQSALRRIIEDNTKTTRFCIICNYVSKIIDPISSRCARFRFSPLSKESQVARLTMIANNENVKVSEDILSFLVDVSEGDLRRSINLLQSISQLGTDLLTPEILNDVCGIIPLNEMNNLYNVLCTSNLDGILNFANDIMASGYDARQLLLQLNDYVINREDLNDKVKTRITQLIMDKEISFMENSSASLELYSLLGQINKYLTS